MKKTLSVTFMCILVCSINAQHPELQTLVNQNKYSEVLTHLPYLTPSDSADYQTIYAVGQAYEGLLKYNDAYRCYLHCLSLDTTRIDMLNTIARTAAYIGKVNDSELFFQKVLQQDDTDFYANYQLGRLYMQAGRNKDAIERFLFLLGKDPDNPVLLRNIGDCYNRTNSLQQAAMYYMQAFQHNKENAILASTLINTLLLIQEPKSALAICDTALQYNHGNYLLRQSKGLVLFTLKEYTQSDDIYSALIVEGDSSYKTLKYGAISKYYAGKYMDAVEALKRAYAEDTTSVEVCLLLGSTLGRTYDRKYAFELFDRAEVLIQPDLAMLNMLKQFRAETFVRDNQTNKAAAIYYELWLANEKPNYLAQIWQLHGRSDLAKTEDETKHQRSLFINVLAANIYLKREKNKVLQHHIRLQLQQFQEYLFFSGLQTYPLLAPDNKKSSITIEQIQELIRQLPEKMPKDIGT